MQDFLNSLSPFAIIIGIWMSIGFIVSRMGWAGLARKYKTSQPFNGVDVGEITVYINKARYRKGLFLEYNRTGIYLKPILIFRVFHPPLLIPWEAIVEVRDKQVFLRERKELVIGNPFIATIRLDLDTFSEIELELRRRSIC